MEINVHFWVKTNCRNDIPVGLDVVCQENEIYKAKAYKAKIEYTSNKYSLSRNTFECSIPTFVSATDCMTLDEAVKNLRFGSTDSFIKNKARSDDDKWKDYDLCEKVKNDNVGDLKNYEEFFDEIADKTECQKLKELISNMKCKSSWR